LNRIDDIIVFEQLTSDNLKNICDIYIQDAKERVMNKTNKKLQVNISKETYEMILNNIESNSINDGARPIKRIVEQFIIDPVTDHLLQYDYESENNVSYINL
jgi:ATP-dependent Clp protease ATP-binding subunit ClpA